MNSYFPALMLLLTLSTGCQRPADPGRRAAVVKIEILQRKLDREGLVMDYQVSNRGKQLVYVVCAEPYCGDPESRYPLLPFYDLHEGRVLAIYSYFVRKPITTDPYHYGLRKLEPGGVFRETIKLPAPLATNPPYPYPTYEPHRINGHWIDTVRLTLGVLPCPNADIQPDDTDGPWTLIKGFYDGIFIKCGAAEGPAWDFQVLVSAEDRIGYFDADTGRSQ